MRRTSALLSASNIGPNDFGTDDAIYQRMKRAILENRLPPGTKLAEERLSGIFGVSREHVRKVLDKLAYDRCVERKPNRGAYVAEPSVEEAHAVFAARRIIEPSIVVLLPDNADEDDYAAFEANIGAERSAHAQDHLNEAIAISGDFHLLLAHASGNQVLAEIMHDLVARSSLVIAMYGWRRYSLCSYDEHEKLLRSLRDGDARGAARLMREHLEAIEQQLRLDPYPVGRVDLGKVFEEI